MPGTGDEVISMDNPAVFRPGRAPAVVPRAIADGLLAVYR